MPSQTDESFPPFRAAAGVVLACLSLSCHVWSVWPRPHTLEIEIHKLGPSVREVLPMFTILFAVVAGAFCISAWRKESRKAAQIATPVAASALLISAWWLLKLFI